MVAIRFVPKPIQLFEIFEYLFKCIIQKGTASHSVRRRRRRRRYLFGSNNDSNNRTL